MENPSWFTADVDPDGSQHKKKLGERPGEPSQLVSRKEVILGNTVWKMLSVDLKSQFIGIFSLGPSILFYFFRGSTPPWQQTRVVKFQMVQFSSRQQYLLRSWLFEVRLGHKEKQLCELFSPGFRPCSAIVTFDKCSSVPNRIQKYRNRRDVSKGKSHPPEAKSLSLLRRMVDPFSG